MLRRLGIAIALAVGLLAAVAAALIAYRAEVAEAALIRWLEARGAEAPALTVTGLDLDGLHLGGLSLGARGELRARAVRAAFTLEGLMAGRLESVTVEGLILDLDLTGPGPPLGALGALIAGPGGPGGLVPPPVAFSAARIEVATAAGPITLDFDGEAWPAADGGLTGAITFELNARAGRLDGVAGLSTRDWRRIVGEAVIDGGRLDLPGAGIGGFSGEIDVAVRTDRPFTGADGWLESLRARLTLSDLSLGRAPFERARLDLDLSERRLEVAAELRGAGPELGLVLAGTIEDYRAAPRLDLELKVALEAGADIWELLAVTPPSAGRVRASLRLGGPLPPRPNLPLDGDAIVAWLAAGELRGHAEVAIDDLDYADTVSGLDAEVTADLALAEDVLELALPSVRLEARALAPTLLAALGVPLEVRKKVARNVALTLPEQGTTPLRLRLERTAAGATARLEGTVRLEAGRALTLDASGEVILDLGEDPPLRRFDLTRLKLRLRDLAFAGQRFERLGFEGAVAGRPGDLGGDGTFEARLPAVAFGAFEAEGVEVRLPATFRARAGALEARLSAPGRLTMARLALGALARPAGPLTFTLGEGRLARDDGNAFSYALTATSAPVELALFLQGGASVAVAVTPGELRLDGGLAAGGYRGRLRVEGARLAVPAHGIVADGVSVAFELDPAREDLDAEFAVGVLRHLAEPAYAAPLRLAGRVGGDGETFTLEVEGFDGDGARRLRVSARHDIGRGPGRGRGEATVTLDPLTFVPEILQPRDIFPVLGPMLGGPVRGNAAATGRFTWSPEGFDGSGVLELDDLSFSLQGISFEGLRTRLTFDSLAPLSTPPGQIAWLRRIDPALPLDDVRLRFRLAPSSPPRLLIERAEMAFAGGRFSVADAVVARDLPSQNLILTIEAIDLSRLFELAGVDGLTGSGLIEGTIPIAVSKDGVVIRDGGLRATGPGVLRYRSEAAVAALQSGGAPVEMMLEALRDFRFSALSATIDKEANDDVNITLHVRGHNPVVLDGHPFAINIDLKSNLAGVLAALREGSVLTGALVDRALKRRP